MIKSMSGFGEGKISDNKTEISCQIRTYNHRFLDITTNLPDTLLKFDTFIRRIISERIKRGSINLKIDYKDKILPEQSINVDISLAKKLNSTFNQVGKKFKIMRNYDIRDILLFPGVCEVKIKKPKEIALKQRLKECINKSLDGVLKIREKEGKQAYEDLSCRVNIIKKAMDKIELRMDSVVKNYRNKLLKKINALGGISLDEGRLTQEVALFIKNSDISEEIHRIKGHLNLLKETIKKGHPVGKEIDFISQELNREINTVQAKVSDFRISRDAIKIKSEIEKIRQQSHNIE